MSQRNRMLRTLRQELLGPRKGPNETMKASPRREYITGILEPQDFHREPSSSLLEAPDVKPSDADYSDEDLLDREEETDAAVPWHSVLDPRAFAKSLGLSFIVTGREPKISVCVTYGTYTKEDGKYVRKPHSYIIRDILLKNGSPLFDDDWTKLTCFIRDTKEGKHVSLFVVNTRSVSPETDYVPTEDLVFQPQIRVCCGGNTEPRAVPARKSFQADEAGFEVLFRKKRAFARGHMCGATWYDEDPERGMESIEVDANPFEWVDAEVLDSRDADMFTAPDFRTDYLPISLVEQVRMYPESASKYNFDAGNLAETWSENALREKIEPMVSDYEAWIRRREENLSKLPPEHQDVIRENLQDCRLTLERLKRGLDMLSDDEVRLTFSFMNKAINIQASWKQRQSSSEKEEGLNWRPFQLAFILSCLPSIVDETCEDRRICDVLWFPTGGGKTEAYLGLAIFTLAYRRRKKANQAFPGLGTAVLSRYTLRLLTVQQFRRCLRLISAAELLRARNWMPEEAKECHGELLWGVTRFSAGLWVGSKVTPNRVALSSITPSAIEILEGEEGEADPAQILNCPCCGEILSVSKTTLDPEGSVLHFIVEKTGKMNQTPTFGGKDIKVTNHRIIHLHGDFYSLEIQFESKSKLKAEDVDNWWKNEIAPALGKVQICSMRASRPGYFLRRGRLSPEKCNFEIRCPNPECELNSVSWFELEPSDQGVKPLLPLPQFHQGDALRNGQDFNDVNLPHRTVFHRGMPIPAYTCDDQIYHRLPSMVIATADKLARLPFEPRAGAIFGNVNRFDRDWGFYRENVKPKRKKKARLSDIEVDPVDPPNLIIQDELHLIDGPLGSMVGLYETAVEVLATKYKNGEKVIPKYVASSATVRHADSQVKAVFNRAVKLFPPQADDIADSFFGQEVESHPVESNRPGRVYMGVCAPGKGAQTPVVRIWAALMQKVKIEEERGVTNPEEIDQFSTVVGYFNAIRELANVGSLYRQDIISRIEDIARKKNQTPREIDPTRLLELSSRVKSSEIPGMLKQLEKYPGNEVDAVLTTSMFGTGIDVSRLGLMIVHGQPKTSSSYIQATGRVGRKMGGLVVTLLRASRPRDLDHYEFFVGYHQKLLMYVEPVTAHPFSPRARERGLGPVTVGILRNAAKIEGSEVPNSWAVNEPSQSRGARLMARRRSSSEIDAVERYLINRGRKLPPVLAPTEDQMTKDIKSEIDKWKNYSEIYDDLKYVEYGNPYRRVRHSVVLGDAEHEAENEVTVYDNAPQSLRDVEATTRFGW